MSLRRALAPTLVGRSSQLRELEEHFRAAGGGSGRLVVISGEAGVGKTRLLAEFLQGVFRDGRAEILEGLCYDEDPAVPYGPVIEALRGWMRRRGSDVVAGPAGSWTGDLARLLPELGQAPPPLSESEAPAQKRRVFEGIYQVLRPGAAQPTRVLVLEDLHWSDQTSQELLRHLARAIEADRILIIGTYRKDELHRRHPLTHWLADLNRELLLAEVDLGPLIRDEVAQIIDAILGRAAPPGLVGAVYDRTAGNPFFVEEILKSLMESGEMEEVILAAQQGRGLDRLQIPLSVRDSVVGRTAGLSDTTTQVLKFAAVIGRAFDFELLLGLTGLTEEVLLKAIADLVERQLVAEVKQEGEDRFEFRHALTREAIYEDLLGREKRRMHLEVLQAIEQTRAFEGNGRVDQLAYHSLKARELEKAAHYAELAGERAAQMCAFREAIAHYEVALELREGAGPREKADLLDRLGQAAHPVGVSSVTFRYWKEARALYEEIGDVPKMAEMDLRLSRISWEAGDPGGAFAHAQSALAGLEAGPPSKNLAYAYSTLSQLHMLSSRPQESIRWGEKAIALAEQLGDDRTKAHSLNNIGVSLGELGQVERGLACLEESLEIALRLGLAFDTARACNNMGELLLVLGRIEPTLEMYRLGVRKGEESGADLSRGFVLGNMGAILIFQGKWAEAEEALARGIRLGEAGMPVVLLVAQPQMARLHLMRGDFGTALGLLEEIRPDVDRGGEYQNLRDVYPMLAACLFRSGRRAEALQTLDRIYEMWRQVGPIVGAMLMMAESAALYAALEVWDKAEALVEGMRSVVARTATPWTRAWLAESEGLLALRADPEAAAAKFGAALEDWNTMGLVPFAARSTMHRGEAILAAGGGDRDRAGADLAQAARTFESLGAKADLADLAEIRARYRLERKPGKPEAGPLASLTPREREVLALLAGGLTNREIAERLVISAKTAEIHVGNILGKLGLKSRAQAAALALEHGLADAAPPSGQP
ncbi:MAG: ATP-binding protein [Anaerolineales bacterium]